jgi:AcrR family transcriptional regulator
MTHYRWVAGSSDWRNRRWEATHRRILGAALELFDAEGFDAVSVGRIAAEAEVSVPTFYAHYPSKEHVVMALPTAEELGAWLSTQPAGLPVGERIRLLAVDMIAAMPSDVFDELVVRWRIIARTPGLRIRAAEFERATAGLIVAHLAGDGLPDPVDVVHAGAYMAAHTAGLLTWADSDGERKLEECLDEAFRALSG